MRSTFAALMTAALIAACGSDDTVTDPAPTGSDTVVTSIADDASPDDRPEPEPDVDGPQRWPDVIDATATFDGETWTIAATLSSPYDTPERYADSWRVIGPDGTVYGERFLTHDHQNEQPFTRSQRGIVIPDDVDAVTIEGRDQEHGWGGGTFELVLER